MTAKKAKAIFQVKVSLLDIEPLICRRIQVPEDTKLPRLHQILQLLFNWEDYHLHDFVVGKRVYSVPDPDDAFNERKVSDERLVPLNRIVDRVGDTFEYVYDFGDDWRHEILLEAIMLPERDVFYPRCIGGARNGPPEDAGGPHGYADYLEALADREHAEHENMLAWRGPFDPEAFSVETINASLKRTFYRRAATKKLADSNGGDREIDHLTKFILAALQGRPTPHVRKKRIAPGTALPLELTDLKRSLATDNLTRRLRVVPPPGKQAVVKYTLDDLDELGGYIAFEANHAKDRKLQKEWDKIFAKIGAILESYTDEYEP
jgi:hypothetical protein